MFGLRFAKASPTTHVMLFKDGKVRREGPGLSLWYYGPTSTLVYVPLASVDVPFLFEQTSSDFQTVSVQGQLTYRVADPRKLAALMDFSVTRGGRYASSDPEKLNDRLIATAQVLISGQTHLMPLRDVLTAYDALRAAALDGMRKADAITMLGLEVLDLTISSIRPAPDVAKALEAQTREELQRRSDEAIYARRNAAVEQERRIKESELNTEIAIEEKKRVKRETQMAAEIAIEEQRQNLIGRRVENEKKEADAQAYAVEALMRAVKDVDWRTLTAMNAGKLDARQNIAMAFRELAGGAAKIGTLNITPDLLDTLMADPANAGHNAANRRPER
jgi:regulator of protease activity HflC (stomatin/prohibitin superfamily)